MIDVGWLEELTCRELSAADAGLYLMDDTLLNRTKCTVKLADMVAMQIPMVAEDVEEVGRYVLHDQNGLLYQSGDVARIADGLAMMLTDAGARKSFPRVPANGMLFGWKCTAFRLLFWTRIRKNVDDERSAFFLIRINKSAFQTHHCDPL